MTYRSITRTVLTFSLLLLTGCSVTSNVENIEQQRLNNVEKVYKQSLKNTQELAKAIDYDIREGSIKGLTENELIKEVEFSETLILEPVESVIKTFEEHLETKQYGDTVGFSGVAEDIFENTELEGQSNETYTYQDVIVTPEVFHFKDDTTGAVELYMIYRTDYGDIIISSNWLGGVHIETTVRH